jgi:DNA-binding transcriptional LysR family regulator
MNEACHAIQNVLQLFPEWKQFLVAEDKAMDINHLREFVAIAHEKNFFEAAESLFISQSSLSKHIKNIENILGTPLFTRTTRKVALNKFGHAFLPFAERICGLYSDGVALIDSMLPINHVDVGSVPPMAQYGITEMIYRFRKDNGSFGLNIIEADSTELATRLNNGSIEMAFMRETDKPNPHFSRICCADDYLAAVLPATHRLFRRESITLSDLRNEDLVVFERSSMVYAICERKCREEGFEMNILFAGHNIDNLANFVVMGVGIALLMNGQTKFITAPTGLKVIAIEPRVNTHINLCWRKDRELSPAAKHLIRSVKHCLETKKQPGDARPQ